MKTESKTAKAVTKLTTRNVPVKLAQRLKRRAKKNNRSANAEVIEILKQSLEGRAA